MLIAVLSDTHNDLEVTKTAVDLAVARGALALVHCGDLASAEVVAVCSRLPMHFVFGNHDADNVPQLLAAAQHHGATCLEWGGVFELAGKKIGVAHGHMTSDLRPIFEAGCDYVLTGHSHETMDRREGKTRRINPGALFRAKPRSFALLDIATDSVEFITVPQDSSASSAPQR